MLLQDTSSVVYLKYAVDSSGLKRSEKASQTKKTGAGVKPDGVSGDSSGILKTYELQSTGLQFSGDSASSRLGIQREFRFSDIDTIRSQSFDRPVPSGPGLFYGHELSPVHRSPQSYNKPNPDWFTIILLLIVFGFVWIWVFYQKILRQIINAFFSSSVANQIVRDENILIQRASVMLSILFYLVSALFLYQISMAFEWKAPWLTNGFSRLIIFALFIALAYSVKLILLKLMGYLFHLDKQVATYIFNIFLMNNILGIVLLPAVILQAYVDTPFTNSIYIGIVILIAAVFLYRLIRGVFIGLTIPRFSVFYLFLYLCAFEIAPLALIFKLAAG